MRASSPHVKTCFADRMRELDPDDWDLGDLDDDEAAELREEVFGTFLDASADVRYFGATMSVDMKGNYEGFEDYPRPLYRPCPVLAREDAPPRNRERGVQQPH